MIQDVLHSSNRNAEKEAGKHEYKYSIRVNENIAIGLFKEKFIKLLIELNDNVREESYCSCKEQ